MRRLEVLSLFLLLAVVGLRPLIGESYDSAESRFATSLGSLTDPSPLRTLVIDGLILLAGLGWLASRAAGRRVRYRWCGIEPGAVLITLAAIVSCAAAGDKRLAINASVDWLVLPVLAILLAQLLRRPWQVRLALCVILASAAAQAAECFDQVFYDFEQSAQNYYEHRSEIWARQGVTLDSPQVELFERRLEAREASGFMWHSNVAGAYLMLTALAAVGLALSKWRARARRFHRLFAVLTGALAIAVAAAAGLTHSRGALGAAVVGLVLAAFFYGIRPWIRRHRGAALALGWGCVAGAAAGVMAFGLARGSLPGSSLDFRWQYWTTSARLIADHPWTGVGMENFGQRYLQYKSIRSPEEVKTPHNFLVSAAADWGLVGLAGVLAMLVGGSVVLARPAWVGKPRAPEPETPGNDDASGPRPGQPALWMILLAAAIFVPRVFLLGSRDYYYLVWTTAFPLLFWLPAFVVFSLDSDRYSRFEDGPLPVLPTLLNCGLIAFLVSDLINFALQVPGSATTFFALFGVAVAVRSRPVLVADRGPVSRRWIPVAAAAVVLTALGYGVIRPVGQARAYLAQARRLSSVMLDRAIEEQPVYRSYLAAAEADPLDPTPLVECAGWTVALAETAGGLRDCLTHALALVDRAIERDPYGIRLYRHRRTLYRELSEATGENSDYRRAADAAGQVIRLYPESPEDWALLGDCWLRVGEVEEDPTAWQRAADAFQRALDLDASRPAWETIRRFSAEKRSKIEEQLATARQMID